MSSATQSTTKDESSSNAVPLLVHSTSICNNQSNNKLSVQTGRQLPFRPSASNDTLNRTSDTFKSGSKDAQGKRAPFNRKCDDNVYTARKYYLDNQGNKIMVRNTIEDFLKTEEDRSSNLNDDDLQSTCSSTLRDSSLSIKQNWGKLPFYDKIG